MLGAVAWAGATLGCGQSKQPMPRLSKFGDQLPTELPALPSAPPPQAETEAFAGTVAEAADQGCSTTIVAGLSEQIIAEGNCMRADSFGRVPELDNLLLGAAVFPYLQQPARDALVRVLEATPRATMEVSSMLRTVAQQYLLYDWYRQSRCGISLAAKPGKSNHETGLAVDIGNYGHWRKHLRRYRFRWYGQQDPWHFDYVGEDAQSCGGWDVEAFQRLWNHNHPDDPIREDGDYGPATEQRLEQTPAQGFQLGPTCGAEG